MAGSKPKFVSHLQFWNRGKPMDSMRNIIKVMTIVVMLIATITVVIVAT